MSDRGELKESRDTVGRWVAFGLMPAVGFASLIALLLMPVGERREFGVGVTSVAAIQDDTPDTQPV